MVAEAAAPMRREYNFMEMRRSNFHEATSKSIKSSKIFDKSYFLDRKNMPVRPNLPQAFYWYPWSPSMSRILQKVLRQAAPHKKCGQKDANLPASRQNLKTVA